MTGKKVAAKKAAPKRKKAVAKKAAPKRKKAVAKKVAPKRKKAVAKKAAPKRKKVATKKAAPKRKKVAPKKAAPKRKKAIVKKAASQRKKTVAKKIAAPVEVNFGALEPTEAPKKIKRHIPKWQKTSKLHYLMLTLITFLSIFPFYWMFIVSSNTDAEISKSPPSLVPGPRFLEVAQKILNA